MRLFLAVIAFFTIVCSLRADSGMRQHPQQPPTHQPPQPSGPAHPPSK